MSSLISLTQITEASTKLAGVAALTPVQKSKRLSEKYKAEIYFKRDDLQEVRSFKIRGAFYLMSSLSQEERSKGVVCASAGNHAQGVAFSCAYLQTKGTIFMPLVTPKQKIEKVHKFGGQWVDIQLVGDTYDESNQAAQAFAKETDAIIVPTFNDPRTIAGQGTLALEVWEQLGGTQGFELTEDKPFDFITVAIGGGGLVTGVGSYLKQRNPDIQIIGVEPSGAASMYESFKAGKVVTIPSVDTFCDGVAVKAVGQLTYEISKEIIDELVIVEEGQVATDMIELYQNEGIITEPAGALAVSALDKIKDKVIGKKVVCVICGGNNDLSKYPEVMERSLIWQGRKYYFLVEFYQKPGQLKKFVDEVLGPNDDITRFEYIKKTNRDKGPALVEVELNSKADYEPLIEKMREAGITFQEIKTTDLLYKYLV